MLQHYEPTTLIPQVNEYETMKKMATILAQSGMLPSHIKSPQAAFAIIQRGRELGIPAMYACNNLYVVNGKATCSAELMAALIYRDHGGKALQFTKTDATGCWIIAKRKDGEPVEFSYTRQEAEQAGAFSGPNKVTWQKYTAAMLRARCISAVARAVFTDSIGGMYIPEELGAPVDEEGNVRDSFIQSEPMRAHAINDTTMKDQETEAVYDPRTRQVVDVNTGEVIAEDVEGETFARSTIRTRDAHVQKEPEAATVQETAEVYEEIEEELISQKQIQLLWATAREAKMTKEQVHQNIGELYPEARDPETQAPSVKQLTRSEAATFIAWMLENKAGD